MFIEGQGFELNYGTTSCCTMRHARLGNKRESRKMKNMK